MPTKTPTKPRINPLKKPTPSPAPTPVKRPAPTKTVKPKVSVATGRGPGRNKVYENRIAKTVGIVDTVYGAMLDAANAINLQPHEYNVKTLASSLLRQAVENDKMMRIAAKEARAFKQQHNLGSDRIINSSKDLTAHGAKLKSRGPKSFDI